MLFYILSKEMLNDLTLLLIMYYYKMNYAERSQQISLTENHSYRIYCRAGSYHQNIFHLDYLDHDEYQMDRHQ